MEGIALELREPFLMCMERALSFYYDLPVPPCPPLQERGAIQRAFECAEVYLHTAMFPLSLSLLTDAILLEKIADSFNKERYTFLEGSGEAKSEIQSILSWNVCMFFGGLPIPFGGVTSSLKRISFISDKILEASKDLVCLQEVSPDAAFALYEKLKSAYRYFYCRINPDSVFWLDSSLFIASKAPISDCQMIALPFEGGIQRAAFSFQSHGTTFIVTHLQPDNNHELRRAQAEAILKAHPEGRRILIGDLNMEREEFLASPLADVFSLSNMESATQTDDFLHRLRPDVLEKDACIDYIVSTSDIHMDIQMGRGYDKEEKTALSDHHPLYATIAGLD